MRKFSVVVTGLFLFMSLIGVASASLLSNGNFKGELTGWADTYAGKLTTTTPASDWWYDATTSFSFEGLGLNDVTPRATLLFALYEETMDWSRAELDQVMVSSVVDTTNPNPNPIPEPSTVLLTGIGLLVFGEFNRKKFIKE